MNLTVLEAGMGKAKEMDNSRRWIMQITAGTIVQCHHLLTEQNMQLNANKVHYTVT